MIQLLSEFAIAMPNVRGKREIGALRGLWHSPQMSNAEISPLDRACYV